MLRTHSGVFLDHTRTAIVLPVQATATSSPTAVFHMMDALRSFATS
jgi:hypothetical protein